MLISLLLLVLLLSLSVGERKNHYSFVDANWIKLASVGDCNFFKNVIHKGQQCDRPLLNLISKCFRHFPMLSSLIWVVVAIETIISLISLSTPLPTRHFVQNDHYKFIFTRNWKGLISYCKVESQIVKI
ncbi:hypothetical protein T4B_13101 [Trichinella pseudospiralis]|uniref:Uncharacterized protein n=2 Tax=Trichinella pseudospiralis TaxID=6337 RepID=A0A0V1JD33_TRIPS|nr:hypothetical protein T4D_12712 [Trichinella pseudospiralis]KRZ32880.1 hypothetical protein T4B_13101 [Trichinella pseudospiralis]